MLTLFGVLRFFVNLNVTVLNSDDLFDGRCVLATAFWNTLSHSDWLISYSRIFANYVIIHNFVYRQKFVHVSFYLLLKCRPNRTRAQSIFPGVKKIKICHCDQKPGAIAFFVETKICSVPNKVQRGRRLPLKLAKLIQILKNNERMLWGKGFVSGRFHTQFVLKILKTIA